MKRIDAIIQPFKLDEVKDALTGIGNDGMTITEVRGHGRQKGHREAYRGHECKVDLLPKVKLEMVVPASRSEEVIQVLTRAAQTGKIGDGKIFVSDISEVVRIRNGDRGETALWSSSGRLRVLSGAANRRLRQGEHGVLYAIDAGVRRAGTAFHPCDRFLQSFCQEGMKHVANPENLPVSLEAPQIPAPHRERIGEGLRDGPL